MITKDNLPLNTTEKEGFKYLMKIIAPLYQMPGRKKITEIIDQKYDILSSIFKRKMQTVPCFTLTTDIWTETMTTKSFLGVTCHFWFNQNVNSMTVGVFEMADRHTSQYLAEYLSNVCEEWNILNSKVTCIVTDNGSNIVKAISDTFGKNRHLPCFAHTLDLVASKITNDIDHIKNIIEKVKSIVTYFKQSVVAADELRKVQLSENILKLIQSVPTRWNSQFYMLERFVKLYEYVAPILLKNSKSPPIIDATDLEIIKEIITILAPIESVSKEISGEKYLTASKIIPIVKCLLKKFENISPQSETVGELKDLTMTEISRRFGSLEQVTLLAVSSILDPRFKRLHFQSPVACANAITFISKSIQSERQQNVDSQPSKTRQAQEVDINTSTRGIESDISNVWSYHDDLVKKASENVNTRDKGDMDLELKMYLNSPTVNINSDPFLFWSNYGCSPEFKKVAFKYLSIVGTSVPSERIFSKTGRILTETRNRLDGKRLNRLLFLSSINLEDWNF